MLIQTILVRLHPEGDSGEEDAYPIKRKQRLQVIKNTGSKLKPAYHSILDFKGLNMFLKIKKLGMVHFWLVISSHHWGDMKDACLPTLHILIFWP